MIYLNNLINFKFSKCFFRSLNIISYSKQQFFAATTFIGFFCLNSFFENIKGIHKSDEKFILLESIDQKVLRIKLPIPKEFNINVDANKFGANFNLNLKNLVCENRNIIVSEDLNNMLMFEIVYGDIAGGGTHKDFKKHKVFLPSNLRFSMDYFWSNLQFEDFNHCIPKSPNPFHDLRYIHIDYKSNILNSVLVQQYFPFRMGHCFISQLRVLLPIHQRQCYVICTLISLQPRLNNILIMNRIRENFHLEYLCSHNSNLIYYLDQLLLIREDDPDAQ